jgi:hypothetical protein
LVFIPSDVSWILIDKGDSDISSSLDEKNTVVKVLAKEGTS